MTTAPLLSTPEVTSTPAARLRSYSALLKALCDPSLTRTNDAQEQAGFGPDFFASILYPLLAFKDIIKVHIVWSSANTLFPYYLVLVTILF